MADDGLGLNRSSIHYGEDHPRPPDDRVPMVLVILDGLGDRAHSELTGHSDAETLRSETLRSETLRAETVEAEPLVGGRAGGFTSSEAARTPVLDELATRGQCGVHVPLGWGRAAASELAHWSLFGFGDIDFPGRTLLEALGRDLQPEPHSLLLFAALRPSHTDQFGRIWITGRVRREEPDVALMLLESVRAYTTPTHEFRLTILDRGEAILEVRARDGFGLSAVSDTDPFFEHLHPMLLPLPLVPSRNVNEANSAESTAVALADYLRWARATLQTNPINLKRTLSGLPALDTLTTKWASVVGSVPRFVDVVGVRGAMVTTSPFYAGLGRLLDMDTVAANRSQDALADSLETAIALVHKGAKFVHVHTKVTDEAGHSKSPLEKKGAVEWCDAQLTRLLEPPFSDWVVAVTGDHATPASGGVLHTGDPTPFVITAPAARRDAVRAFGEEQCRGGILGVLAASDVLPLMCSHANRPRFLGHRPSAYPTIALPDDPVPFR